MIDKKRFAGQKVTGWLNDISVPGLRTYFSSESWWVKTFKDRWREAVILPSLVCSLRPARRGAADERALTEAGSRTVHRVHEEMESFVLTQDLAVTTQGPISALRSSVGHIQEQISHYEP